MDWLLLNGQWGFINKNGILVIDYHFNWVADFSEGVAVMKAPEIFRRARCKRTLWPAATGR